MAIQRRLREGVGGWGEGGVYLVPSPRGKQAAQLNDISKAMSSQGAIKSFLSCNSHNGTVISNAPFRSGEHKRERRKRPRLCPLAVPSGHRKSSAVATGDLVAGREPCGPQPPCRADGKLTSRGSRCQVQVHSQCGSCLLLPSPLCASSRTIARPTTE